MDMKDDLIQSLIETREQQHRQIEQLESTKVQYSAYIGALLFLCIVLAFLLWVSQDISKEIREERDYYQELCEQYEYY